MDASDLEQYRTRLLASQAELAALLETARESQQAVELDQSRVGRLSRMDALQTQQLAQETGRRREQQLLQIAAALRRIDAGDFGYCSTCDEAIDPRRLQVDPTATRCVACQSLTG